MSKFSEYLRNLINESGESISAISRSIGAERTSIHKALSDERVLPYKVVQNLARHFNLSLDERQEFLRLYYILLQGEESYRNRQAVCELLNHLSSVEFHKIAPPVASKLPSVNSLIRGEYAVHSVIRSLLISESEQEKAEFHLLLPSKLNLTIELMELWLSGREFYVDQILCFYTQKDASVENIRLLGSVIPLCMASVGKYQPYYFHNTSDAVTLSPMSYYIITPNYLLQFSEDLSCAQLQGMPELIEHYNNYYQRLIQCCDPLTQCNTSILDILQEYITTTAPDEIQVMMAQPCTARYYTPEIIHKYMRSSNVPYQDMLALVERHFSVLRQNSMRYCSIFTEKGLLDLFNSNVIVDLPPQFVPPLEHEDILAMLRQLRSDIAKDNICGFITRPTQLKLPDYLSISVSAQNKINIYPTNAFLFGAYCCNIHISDESLCRIFQDFVQSLPGSPMVYSKEDCLKLLDQLTLPF